VFSVPSVLLRGATESECHPLQKGGGQFCAGMERIRKMDQKGVPDSHQGRESVGRRGSSVPHGEVDATYRFEQKSVLVLPTGWSGASTSTMPLNAR